MEMSSCTAFYFSSLGFNLLLRAIRALLFTSYENYIENSLGAFPVTGRFLPAGK